MLETIRHGAICELRLARPPANALNPALIAALTEALISNGESADAIVISGRPGMFSAGLDIPELMDFDRDQLSRFWQSFLKLLRTIAKSPVLTAFALTGHAPAGGIVLSLFGDYRIMPRGNFKTGLNEVQVGLVVPAVVHAAVKRCTGAHTAERILVAGEMMNSEQALTLGLVDELVDEPDDTVTRAVEWCQQRLALPRRAMLTTRALTRADLHRLFHDGSELGVEKFVDVWFSDFSQKTLRDLVDRLKNK